MEEFDYKQRPGTPEFEKGYKNIDWKYKCKCKPKPLTGILIKDEIVCKYCKKSL